MNAKTQNEIKIIQAHINKNFYRWFKTYSNVEGVHVGEKEVNGKKIENDYSVVFHVNRKEAKPLKKIPAFIYIKIKNKCKLRIRTDVIEAGSLKLNGIKIGDRTQNKNSAMLGTISVYFSTPQGFYLGSNMHVLAPNMLSQGTTFYDVRRGGLAQTILLFDEIITTSAQLIVARFKEIDFAFAKIDNPQIPNVVEKEIKGVGAVNGILGLTHSNYTSVNVSFYGSTSGLNKNCSILELGAKKKTQFSNIILANLIRLKKCTLDGDSGAPLFDDQNRIVGVIVGSDNNSSYALHINDIINFFQTSNL